MGVRQLSKQDQREQRCITGDSSSLDNLVHDLLHTPKTYAQGTLRESCADGLLVVQCARSRQVGCLADLL